MKIKAEVLPGDLTDSRLVHADRRCEVWLGGVNRQSGYVLLITCPALLNLRKSHNKLVNICPVLIIVESLDFKADAFLSSY